MQDMNTSPAGERLARWARLAWDEAPRLCASETGCSNYHRCWSLVRLLGSDGALPNSSDFFIRELVRLVRTGAQRVLFSGAADTGLLALGVLAAREAGVPLQFVVADRCETPLMQNRIYAQEQGLEVEFHRGDITALACEPADVLIGHSFLLFFPEPERQRVIDTWARLVKPGGHVLMFGHVVEHDHDVMMQFDENSIEERVRKLCEAALGAGWREDERGELQAALRRFWLDWRAFQPSPSVTARNLRLGFAKAGFEVLQLEPLGASRDNGPIGVGSSLSANRAELVARRRA